MWVRHRARRRGRGQVLAALCDASDTTALHPKHAIPIFLICATVSLATPACDLTCGVPVPRAPGARTHTTARAAGAAAAGAAARAAMSMRARQATAADARAAQGVLRKRSTALARAYGPIAGDALTARCVLQPVHVCAWTDARTEQRFSPAPPKKARARGGGGRGVSGMACGRVTCETPAPRQACEELYARTAIAQAEG